MKIKNAILAVILAAGFPMAAQAQDVENYDGYRVSCESGVVCNNFNVNYQQSETSDEIAQRTRPRRTRRSGSDKKLYFGATPGIAILGSGANVGIGGGIFGGYNFSERTAVELEIFDYFGGLDDDISSINTVFDDSGYNYLGIAANGVFKYPFSEDNPRSFYGFAGIGLGYGRFSFTGDFGDLLDDENIDSSFNGILFNTKIGVGYPISDSLDLMGQFRYANTFLDEINSVTVQQDAFTFDIGAKLNL